MGNCCAAKQGHKPIKTDPNTIKKVVKNKKHQDFDEVLKEDNEKVAAGARGQTLNRLAMLDPKDGVSNPSSLLSSTVVHDGTFQSNNNKNQTNQGGKSQKRFSPSSKYASLLSDPGIPDEMDENVPRESLY